MSEGFIIDDPAMLKFKCFISDSYHFGYETFFKTDLFRVYQQSNWEDLHDRANCC